MFDRVSERAGEILLVDSRKIAQELGSPRVETEHVLLAILRKEDCIASNILRKVASPKKLEDEILRFQATLPPSEPFTGAPEEMSFSDEVKDAISRSDDESARDGVQTIGSEHVLLALATQIPNGRAFKILKKIEVNYGQLTAALDELYPKKAADSVPAEGSKVKVHRTVGFVFFDPALRDEEIETRLYTIMQIKGVKLVQPIREDPRAVADLPPQAP